jgi:predicted nucleic acid-binding Zn ribbon protein
VGTQQYPKSGRGLLLLFGAGSAAIFAMQAASLATHPGQKPTSTEVVFLILSSLGFVTCLGYAFVSALARARGNEAARAMAFRRGFCPTCGYDIRGNEQACSECGEPLPEELVASEKTPILRRVIRAAIAEARLEGCDYVGTQHVLYALMREQNSIAACALTNLGLSEESLRREVGTILQSSTSVKS